MVLTFLLFFSSDRSGDDVCPWEATGSTDNVCPWEATTPTQRIPPQQPTPTHRLVQSLHHSLPPRAQLSKPRPDRSKSVDVNPVGSQRPPLSVPFAPTLGPIRGSSPSESPTVTQKGEKAQSVDVCPWESQPPTKKAPVIQTASPKEVLQTTLAPTGGQYLVSERRASEGVLRMALGVCPLEEVLHISQKPKQKEGEIKITVPSTVGGDRVEGAESSSAADKILDYTVRSGHLRGLFGLHSEPKSSPETTPPPLSMPKGPLELSITTSMAAITCGTITGRIYESSASQEQPCKAVSQAQHHSDTEESYQISSSRQMSPKGDFENLSTKAESQGHATTPSEEVETSSLTRSPNTVAPWEDSGSQREEVQAQITTDVCPWEDE